MEPASFARSPSPAAALLAGGAVAALSLGLVFAAVLVAVLGGVGSIGGGIGGTGGAGAGISMLARRDIPPAYLGLYQASAARYGIDWSILAGIGRVECDHGRDPDPSCTHPGSVNAAGAGGPMQFLASTWASFGVDGSGDGVADRWNPADAIYSAAAYVRASGAPSDYSRAIFAYNHASWYVAEVERWAARYRAGPATTSSTSADGNVEATTTTTVRLVAGDRAVLAPGDGHLALVPAGAPTAVQAMVIAGNELQSLPYGPEGHPDPRGAPAEDCSSTLNYVLYRSGLRPLSEILADNPLAQDYLTWGAPGRGRWVTVYATPAPTPHVFVVIASLRLDTSHAGTDVGPNSAEDGPRWRILDHVPTWARWSVRHPPGL